MELSLSNWFKPLFQLSIWTGAGLLFNTYLVNNVTGGFMILWTLCYFAFIPYQTSRNNYKRKKLDNDVLVKLNNDLKKEYNNQQSVIESLQVQVKTLSNNNTSLESNNKSLQSNIESLQSRYDQQKDRLDTVVKSLEESNSSLAECKISIEEKERKILSLTNSRNKYEGMYNKLKEAKNEKTKGKSN